MNIIMITAILLILGTVLAATGFGTFPPIIYTGNNVQEKLDLLAAQPRRWVLSQLIVILGGLVSVAGSVFLVLQFRESQGILPAWVSAAGFILGHVFWIRIVVMRILEPWRQAKDEFPGWLYGTFSILTLLGLAGFGVAFWLQGIYPVLGVGLFIGALAILGLFLKLKGMPPIVYFSMTFAIGLTLLF
jgi:hypothetical protein